MLERLNESFMRLSQFSSNLAHDMRTPLTNLQAAAQVVLSQPRSADEYRNVIESSIDEYQRLSRMIEDMLFLARSEQAGTSISVRRLDASEEAGRVAGYYEPLAEDAGVTVKVDGHAWVDADLTLYQRALSNLLSNALAYAPRGSIVTIDCVEQGGATTIAVSDTGPASRPSTSERSSSASIVSIRPGTTRRRGRGWGRDRPLDHGQPRRRMRRRQRPGPAHDLLAAFSAPPGRAETAGGPPYLTPPAGMPARSP